MVAPQPTLICVPLTSPTPTTSLAQAEKAKTLGADLVELRIDLLENQHDDDWRSIIQQASLPFIVTYRHESHGGFARCENEERLKVLGDARRLPGVMFVDVEMDFAEEIIGRFKKEDDANDKDADGAKVIVSYHSFGRCLSEEKLAKLYGKIVGVGADVVKIAMKGEGEGAVCDMLRLLQGSVVPCIGIAMGFAGVATRILAGKFGAVVTFACLEDGEGSAPGQVSIKELLEVYRFRRVGRDSQVYGIIGRPLGHSMSPVLHNMAFEAMGVDGVFVPVELYGDQAGLLVRRLIQVGFKGLCVTIPAKVDAMIAMDFIEPAARQIEAINTVTTNNIYVAGFNTDWSAALTAIARVFDPGFTFDDQRDAEKIDILSGKNVVCVGAGGTARAIIYGSLRFGARSVLTVNRTLENAELLVELVGDKRVSAMSLDNFCKTEDGPSVDILANTTSLGMSPKTGVTPVPAKLLKPGMVVFDAVYNPLETELIRLAKANDCKTVSGLDMFVGQAERQLKHWFPFMDDKIPYKRMREAVVEALERRREAVGVKR